MSEPKPKSIVKTIAERHGGHIVVRVFEGVAQGSLALTGTLTFDERGYEALITLLHLGAGECRAHNLDYDYHEVGPMRGAADIEKDSQD